MPQRPTLTKPLIDTDKLVALIEQWARADVMSRMGCLSSDIDYAHIKLEKEDEIRTYLFGTCSLTELALRWGVIR